MPCNMYEGATAADFIKDDVERAKAKAQEAIDEANKMADILCSFLRNLAPEQIEKLDAKTRDWFRAHLEHDKANGRP